jgi:hypothetical protein
MGIGFTNTFVFQVGDSAYDLRLVAAVMDHPTNATLVMVVFSPEPTRAVLLPRATFVPAYQAALLAQATGGGGGSVTDGDKGDIVVSGGGTVWTLEGKGAANGIATLDGAGKVPLAQIPAAVITDVFVVASQGAMLALAASPGDVAVRTDSAETFILQASPASTLSNWVELRATEVVTAAQITDSTAAGRAILTAVSVAAQRTALRIDGRTVMADANFTAAATDHLVVTSVALTAPRTVTLPLANSVNPGYELIVADAAGVVTGTNTLTVGRSGSDTINGVTAAVIGAPYGMRRFISNGAGAWTFDGGVLRASENLAGLTNLAVARSNLGVLSAQDSFLQALIFG